MTIREAAPTALDGQDACNLSGVLASFNKIVIDVLWPEARRLNEGTEWVNQHPICTLFLDKLSDLNRRGDFYAAHDEVESLANGVEAVNQ
jgi:hypothetical protein